MTRDHYILVDKEPVPCADAMEWALWFEQADRRVAENTTPEGARVSTVFLGLDHNFGFADPRPLLFETMVFGGAHHERQRRYATWDEAVRGHAAMFADAVQIETFPLLQFTLDFGELDS